MKKLLQFSTALTLTFGVIQCHAQLDNGSIASDFTFTDLNGNTQHLYSILDSGKTVFIDVSAAWCGPCWSYHTGGALEGLYNTYGPAGTDEVRVMFIEGELTNTLAQLNGVNAGSTYAGSTQGDWVTGTSYPIVNLSTSTTGASAFMTNYDIGYFPTIYMICPDRSVTEVGTKSTSVLYAAKSACFAATVAADGEMITSLAYNTTLASCDSVTPTFRIGNIGLDTLTSATITLNVDGVAQKTINWTGSLATYASTTFTGIKVGSTVSGSHTVTAVISDPNGVVDPTSANNSTTASFIIYPTVGGAYIAESFESAGIPNSWMISAGGSSTWEDAIGTGFNSPSSAILSFYNISAGQVDMMTLPPMSFSSSSATASLTFDVAYAQYKPENTDKLQVQVSTNCGTTWVTKYNKSGNTLKTVPPVGNSVQFVPTGPSEWRRETVNLNTYAGQTNVLVRFNATSNYGNNLYVDNINFTQFGVGIQENEMFNTINVYPNPVTTNATIDFNLAEANSVSIELVNTVGQVVITENLGNRTAGVQNYSLDATSLNNGLYFLNIKIGNNTITKKVAVNK